MKDFVSRASVWMYKQLPTAAETKKATEVSSRYASEAVKELQSVFVVGKSPGFMFVRLAGLSGALAVAFGAYGAHGKRYGHTKRRRDRRRWGSDNGDDAVLITGRREKRIPLQT